MNARPPRRRAPVLLRLVRAATVLVAVGLAGCGGGAEDDPVLATVDGAELRASDFRRSYIDYLVTTGQNDTEATRTRHFEALVDAYLLGAEAERQGLAADSAVQAGAEVARRRLVGARFYESSVLDTLAAPDEADVQRAYALGREQRVVRQLFFADAASAAAAHDRIRAGRTFLDEAQGLYGTDDPQAGALGAVSYWELDDAFAEAAFSTPVGEVSPPVRSRLGWHVIWVEDRLRNPLLTESEFQTRRAGVESQLRLRRRRMEGDSFVRTFMEAREVAVNRPALEALVAAIRQAGAAVASDAQQGASAPFTAAETQAIVEALTPQTPLASFSLRGERVVFTVADYVGWLDVLPAAEARERAGASLGRALRNEAFARAGEAAGLADHSEVRAELDRRRRLRLADALRARLRDSSAPTDRARLDRVAGDLGLSGRRTVADFWVVPAATRADADAALRALAADPAAAARRPGYRAFEATPLAEVPELAAAVGVAPLGQAVLASVGDGWAVVRVEARRSEAVASGAEALAPLAAEADLIRRLRAERPVEVDGEALAPLLRPPPMPSGRR